jgi:SAM-dependent methyltransferase
VQNVEQAKAIILTPGKVTTEQRWREETPVLAQQLTRELGITAEHLVLDYGCGIGRLAKALIEMHGCRVIGADISLSMIQLAPRYVCSHRFGVFHPELLDMLIARGVRFDSAYAVWVIQHCPDPQTDLARIRAALRPGGLFHIVNTRPRFVPTDAGWVNDGIDLIPMLRSLFAEVKFGDLPQVVLAHAGSLEVAAELFYCATCTA